MSRRHHITHAIFYLLKTPWSVSHCPRYMSQVEAPDQVGLPVLEAGPFFVDLSSPVKHAKKPP